MNEGWKDRLITEQDELGKRLTKLQVFLVSPEMKSLSPRNQQLLLEQEKAMLQYQDVLQRRLEANP